MGHLGLAEMSRNVSSIDSEAHFAAESARARLLAIVDSVKSCKAGRDGGIGCHCRNAGAWTLILCLAHPFSPRSALSWPASLRAS